MTERRATGSLPLVLIVLLALVALVLRVAFVLDHDRNHPLADRPVIDAASYERWALEIADGDWVGDEVFFQEPLYPYVLGTIHALGQAGGVGEAHPDGPLARRRALVRWVQAAWGALTVLLVGLVTLRLFGPWPAVVAALGMATYRPLLYFPALFLKPNLFLPVLVLALGLLLRAGDPADEHGRRRWWGPWLLGGLLCGLGALLRGNMLLCLPFVLCLPLVRCVPAAGWRGAPAAGAPAAAWLLAGMLAALLPVALRNQAVGGVFALTTSGAGTNLYGGNNAENPYGRATEFSWVRGIPEHEADDWRHEAERRSGRSLDAGEVSSFWLGETLASIRSDPALHARILWNKLRLTLGSYEVPDNAHLAWDSRYLATLRWPLGGFGLWGTLGLAGVGAFLLRRGLGAADPRDPRGAWELLAFLVLYLGTIVATVTSMRARLPLVPLLVPFAGWFVACVLPQAVRRRRFLGAGAALALAAAVVHVPVFDAAEREEDLRKRDYNLAVHLIRDGRLDEAETLARGLGEGKVPTQLLLADVDLQRGFRLAAQRGTAGQAAAAYRAAREHARLVLEGGGANGRDRFRARRIAGFASCELSDWRDAEEQLRAALAFDPEDLDVQVRLAGVLLFRADEESGEARLVLLGEARDLLRALVPATGDPGLRARLADLEAELSRATGE